ncbi:hypothetical protein ACLBXM_06915 [Xanthobacteraceae bacterium A53D]
MDSFQNGRLYAALHQGSAAVATSGQVFQRIIAFVENDYGFIRETELQIVPGGEGACNWAVETSVTHFNADPRKARALRRATLTVQAELPQVNWKLAG